MDSRKLSLRPLFSNCLKSMRNINFALQNCRFCQPNNFFVDHFVKRYLSYLVEFDHDETRSPLAPTTQQFLLQSILLRTTVALCSFQPSPPRRLHDRASDRSSSVSGGRSVLALHSVAGSVDVRRFAKSQQSRRHILGTRPPRRQGAATGHLPAAPG